jgi:hypothetical protein
MPPTNELVHAAGGHGGAVRGGSAERPTDPLAILNLWNPALDPIRDHPRFRATLQRFGLPFTVGAQP